MDKDFAEWYKGKWEDRVLELYYESIFTLDTLELLMELSYLVGYEKALMEHG